MTLPTTILLLGAWLISTFIGLSPMITSVTAAPGLLAIDPDDRAPIDWYGGNNDDALIEEGRHNLTRRVDGPNEKISYYPLKIIQSKGKTIVPSPLEFSYIMKPKDSSSTFMNPLASTRTCLFYSGLRQKGGGPLLSGPQAQKAILRWYNCNVKELTVDPFTGATPRSGIVAGQAGDPRELATYHALMSSVDFCNVDELRDSGGDISARYSADGWYSQAFSEACTGVVYYFGASDANPFGPAPLSVWTNYELPALRSSGKVTNIVWVDYNRGIERDDNGRIVHPIVIWSPGDSNARIAAPAAPSTAFRYFLLQQGGTMNPNQPPNGGNPKCRHA
ncbi:hypothetical protein B0H66DRAFT_601353 [Apodospora peruviana]|uniref:Uncharacterized protein n=1 Tax=Apodospora peruviana TaxID=516989 RepID=A0AAE0M7Y2_9PEZI|nr:hypothetical protein B0H66DRAFT_601353 [Apodospora peruviana]